MKHLLKARLEEVLARGPFPKCGGCGAEPPVAITAVRDKKDNRGFLCDGCAAKYAPLLRPDSIRNFWMCGVCGYRVLAGTTVDASIDTSGNTCPNCTTDVNVSLVNLSGDRPIGSGVIGEPVE